MLKYIYLFFVLTLFAVVSITAINFYVLSFSNIGYYKKVENLEKRYVGLVFGASVIGKSTPSDILKDRLIVAYQSYQSGKIEKILVSGDNSQKNYNEPVAMQKYLIHLGVDVDDVYLDYAGFDTYDSLYRAKEIFGVKEITLFTQDFHLKRALYIGKRLGLKTQGIETNLQKYIQDDYNNKREMLARVKAFLEVEILKAEPTYLGDSIEIITDEKIGEAKKKILE
ncbi:hypothetical protein A9Q91_04870 [Candidatus Gracilibacteria bacterium 28_42_T64]|nr:hypothetical protein A9Q91_04870 [Candidatus Gracilibacteria bacterium 28_42_T64]